MALAHAISRRRVAGFATPSGKVGSAISGERAKSSTEGTSNLAYIDSHPAS